MDRLIFWIVWLVLVEGADYSAVLNDERNLPNSIRSLISVQGDENSGDQVTRLSELRSSLVDEPAMSVDALSTRRDSSDHKSEAGSSIQNSQRRLSDISSTLFQGRRVSISGSTHISSSGAESLAAATTASKHVSFASPIASSGARSGSTIFAGAANPPFRRLRSHSADPGHNLANYFRDHPLTLSPSELVSQELLIIERNLEIDQILEIAIAITQPRLLLALTLKLLELKIKNRIQLVLNKASGILDKAHKAGVATHAAISELGKTNTQAEEAKSDFIKLQSAP